MYVDGVDDFNLLFQIIVFLHVHFEKKVFLSFWAESNLMISAFHKAHNIIALNLVGTENEREYHCITAHKFFQRTLYSFTSPRKLKVFF